jgi:hypothetical protein
MKKSGFAILKAVRLRVAGDYRLLLQLLPDTIRVVDLEEKKGVSASY